MHEKYKVIIIGTSLTGKTTLIRFLRETTDLHIQEIDEEISKLNGGEWPKDMEYKNKIIIPPIIANVLAAKKIIFLTNTSYFSPKDLQIARDKGFKIIQLFVDKQELEKRNRQRMQNEGYEDHSQWFDSMLQYQKDIKEKGLVDGIINTDKPVEEIAEEFLNILRTSN